VDIVDRTYAPEVLKKEKNNDELETAANGGHRYYKSEIL
jgi:hypothetical protein